MADTQVGFYHLSRHGTTAEMIVTLRAFDLGDESPWAFMMAVSRAGVVASVRWTPTIGTTNVFGFNHGVFTSDGTHIAIP